MKTFRVRVNGKEYEVEVEETGVTELPPMPQRAPASTAPKAAQSAIASTPKSTELANSPADGKLSAPMPGTVLRIVCKDGETVKKGDTILVLEAMKMENDIQSPADCKIEKITVSEGQSVDAGDLLVQLAI